MKKQKIIFNFLLRKYRKYKAKLDRFELTNRNEHRQGVLRKHIERLEEKLHNLLGNIKKAGAIAAVSAALALAPNTAGAQIQFAAPVQNPFGLADIGAISNSNLIDLDGDGDLDLMSGERFGNFFYFENTAGAGNMPAFSPPVQNPFGLADIGSFSSPNLIDLDGDGDLDLMSGYNSGNFIYFENTAGTGNTPVFLAPVLNPFMLADIGSFSSPNLIDLDGDGDLDVMSGLYYGNFIYFENTGTATAPSFAASDINPFGLADIGYLSNSDLIDLDGDGDLDLMSGEVDGNFSYFENIGTATAPIFAPLVINPFGLSDIGSWSNSNLIDLDGDGDLDLMSGEQNGLFFYFENITPLAGKDWAGATSTDWNTASNWSPSGVPGATDDVTIPDVSGASNNFPDLTTAIAVGDVTIDAGAQLLVSPGVALTVSAGKTITNNGSLTLEADATGSGMLDDFTNAGASYTGSITVEQFVSPGSGVGQRMFGSPVNNGVVSGLSQTYASGSTGQIVMSNCATALVDVGSPYNNLFEWNEAVLSPNNCAYEAWFAQTQTSPLQNGRGYSAWMQDGSVFSFTGTPNTGNVSYGGALGNLASGLVNKDGWHVLSNPYPSPMNASALTAANWNSLQTYDPGQAFGGTFQPINPGQDLGVAQGFVGFTTANSNTAGFTNAMRNTNSSTFKSNTNWFTSKLNIEVNGNGFNDISYIYFNDEATLEFDNKWDCKKKASDAGQPTLFTSIAGEKVSLNGQAFSELGANSVPLGLDPGTNGQFTFEVSGLNTLPASVMVYLEDKALGTWTNLSATSTYSFAMTTVEAEDRFEVHFTKPIALNHAAESCAQNDGTISVDFGNQSIAGNLVTWEYELSNAGQFVSASSEANLLEFMDLAPGDYELMFTNGNLQVTEYITIEDKVQVEAEFTSNTTTLFAGDELILSNTSLGATTYEWTINGELFNTTNLNYTFASAGTYVVRLSASNNDCDAAYEATIIVNEKTTGIAEQIELDNAIIYANGKTITVDLSNVELDGKSDLEIYNMVGKLMVQKMNVTDFEYVDMDQAVSGIYIVKIINQTASISKKVILK